jgi:hypothetical protein
MKGPKPVCTLATNKTNQSNPRRLRRFGLGGGMRSVGSLPSPPVGGANSSAGVCSAGLLSGSPTECRDDLANSAGSLGEDSMETAAT